MRYTLKQIKEFVKQGEAYNITTIDEYNLKRLTLHENGFKKIAVSMGIHGKNGALLEGYKTGRLYAILARNTNLMKLVK